MRTLAEKTSVGVMLLVAASSASMVPLARGKEASACRPRVWADAIAKFQKEDAREPPPKGAALFVGSSSIRMWNLKKSFPDVPTINRGFGGSQICDSTHYADVLVTPHAPRIVVFYAGDNDIAAGKPPEVVQRDFREFVAEIRKPLPEAQVVFISIKPSIARWKLADKMKEANRLISADCKEEDKLKFVDVWDAMLGENGEPRQELLRDDGLHLNAAGYELWAKLLRPHLEEKR